MPNDMHPSQSGFRFDLDVIGLREPSSSEPVLLRCLVFPFDSLLRQNSHMAPCRRQDAPERMLDSTDAIVLVAHPAINSKQCNVVSLHPPPFYPVFVCRFLLPLLHPAFVCYCTNSKTHCHLALEHKTTDHHRSRHRSKRWLLNDTTLQLILGLLDLCCCRDKQREAFLCGNMFVGRVESGAAASTSGAAHRSEPQINFPGLQRPFKELRARISARAAPPRSIVRLQPSCPAVAEDSIPGSKHQCKCNVPTSFATAALA